MNNFQVEIKFKKKLIKILLSNGTCSAEVANDYSNKNNNNNNNNNILMQ